MPSLGRPGSRGIALSGAFLFLAAFSVYTATHCASLFLDDSGETITVAAGLGVGHPPGYPLHSLLTHLAVLAWPYGSPAEAVNLLAGVLAAAAVSLLGLLVQAWAIEGDALAHAVALALLPTAILATGPVWWHNALGAKGGIYQLNNLFSLSLLALLLSPGAFTPRRSAGFWLLLGLAFSHHYMSQLPLLPAYAWALWPQRRRALQSSWLLIPGLALYLYLPLRAAWQPSLNWGDIRSWHAFWFFFLRLQYASGELTRSAATSTAQAAYALGLMLKEGGGCLLPLALLGAWWGRRNRVDQALALGWALSLAAVTLYLNLQADRLDLMQPYLFPAYITQTLLASRALLEGARRWPAWRRPALGTLAAVALALGTRQWPLQDLSRYYAALDNARGLLLGLPAHSLLLAQGDAQIFPLWYLQRVRHEREDVAVVGLAVLPMAWVREDLARRYPDLRHPIITGPIGAESIPRLTQAYLELNSQRPLYAGFNQWPGPVGDWQLSSNGPAFLAHHGALTQTAAQRALARAKILARPLRGLIHAPLDPRTQKLVLGDLAIHFNVLGVDAEASGSYQEALGFYEDAAHWDPRSPEFPFNSGNAYNDLTRPAQAVEAYRQALVCDPHYENALYNEGVTLYRSGRLPEAREAFRAYLALSPDHPDVRQVLEQLGP